MADNWTHSAWRSEPTDAARAVKLRLHMDEINGAIGHDVGSGSMSLSTGELRQLLADLQVELDKLEARLSTSRNRSGIVRAKF